MRNGIFRLDIICKIRGVFELEFVLCNLFVKLGNLDFDYLNFLLLKIQNVSLQFQNLLENLLVLSLYMVQCLQIVVFLFSSLFLVRFLNELLVFLKHHWHLFVLRNAVRKRIVNDSVLRQNLHDSHKVFSVWFQVLNADTNSAQNCLLKIVAVLNKALNLAIEKLNKKTNQSLESSHDFFFERLVNYFNPKDLAFWRNLSYLLFDAF